MIIVHKHINAGNVSDIELPAERYRNSLEAFCSGMYFEARVLSGEWMARMVRREGALVIYQRYMEALTELQLRIEPLEDYLTADHERDDMMQYLCFLREDEKHFKDRFKDLFPEDGQ